MRGKVTGLDSVLACFRITPAYAGKSPLSGGVGAALRDHPRLCGEKARQVLKLDKAEGSPPPMRGKVHVLRLLRPPARITPAYAGKSDFGKVGGSMAEGSPPPMRGKAATK